MKNNFQYKFLMPKEVAQKKWDELRRDIGGEFNGMRREQELNILEVADSLSLPIGTIDDIENGIGKVSLDKILYLCRFYGVVPHLGFRRLDEVNYDRSEEKIAALEFAKTQYTNTEADNAE